MRKIHTIFFSFEIVNAILWLQFWQNNYLDSYKLDGVMCILLPFYTTLTFSPKHFRGCESQASQWAKSFLPGNFSNILRNQIENPEAVAPAAEKV